MATYNKEQRANVYIGTIDDIGNGFYYDKNTDGHFFNLSKMASGSRFYQKIKVPEGIKHDKAGVIYTQLIDCVQKAYDFGEEGALLNMASRFKPGGGVMNGSAAQEEEIFRRTTLGYSLYMYDDTFRETYNYPEGTPKITAYPIKGDKAGIWSPCVDIYKKGPQGYYDFMVNPGVTNVITVPAVQKPELTEGGTEFKEPHAKMWRNKIRSVLRIALMHKKYKLVLGAWGCGAYGNPPRLVAGLFKEILSEEEFDHAFDEICFAIIEDKNSPKGGNYAPFAEVFGHK